MKLLIALILLSAMTDAAAQKPIKFLALGDSYTIGESVAEAGRWPNQLADSLRHRGVKIANPEIIATTGWRTDDLKNAVVAANLKNDYQLVTLLIGVNNQYQGKPVAAYAPEFEELLEMAIRLAQGKKENVIVVSIPDYGFTPFGAEKKAAISKALDEFNACNAGIAKKHGITYVDITPISRTALTHPALVAADGLHPSAEMYSLWVGEIVKRVHY